MAVESPEYLITTQENNNIVEQFLSLVFLSAILEARYTCKCRKDWASGQSVLAHRPGPVIGISRFSRYLPAMFNNNKSKTLLTYSVGQNADVVRVYWV